MKIKKSQLKQLIKEELESMDESWALLGQAVMGMLSSSSGRSILTKVLRWPESFLQWVYKADDYVWEKLGTESPELVNKLQEISTTVQTGGFTKMADLIEGMDDEEAAALSGAMEMTTGPADPQPAPGHRDEMYESKERKRITKSQLKQIIMEELSDTLGHKASRKLSRVGIAHESEDVRKEIMDMILALDTGDEQDAETLANMAAYLKDASAANVRQGLGLEEQNDLPGKAKLDKVLQGLPIDALQDPEIRDMIIGAVDKVMRASDPLDNAFHKAFQATDRLGLEEKKDHPGETCKQAHPDESHEKWEKSK